MDTSWLRSSFEELKACSGASREALLETLSPTRCAGCERPGALLCDDCLNKLVLIDPEESCALCGAPYGRVLCTECRGTASSLDRCLACALFSGALPRVIRAYKDGGERRLARSSCLIRRCTRRLRRPIATGAFSQARTSSRLSLRPKARIAAAGLTTWRPSRARWAPWRALPCATA